MNIIRAERGPAPLTSATIDFGGEDIALIVGALRAFAGKRSLFVRTQRRRRNAERLLEILGAPIR